MKLVDFFDFVEAKWCFVCGYETRKIGKHLREAHKIVWDRWGTSDLDPDRDKWTQKQRVVR